MTYLLNIAIAILAVALFGETGAAAYASSADTTATVRSYRLYFACDKTSYDENYLDNRLTADAVVTLLGELDPENIDSVTVTAYASPEGVYEHNLMLSRLRARDFETLAKTRFPMMNGQFRLIDGGEAWAPFRQQVAEDLRLGENERVRILNLLDDDSVRPDTKKWRLQNRFGAETWRYILRNHFTYLRCVEIVIVYGAAYRKENEAEMVAPEAEVAIVVVSPTAPSFEEAMLVDAVDTTAVEDILPPTVDENVPAFESFEVPQEGAAVIAEPEAREETEPGQRFETPAQQDTILPVVLPVKTWEQKPLFALSTNTLLDLAITPNFAIEVPMGHSWSALVDYTFPWWLTRANDRAWQIIKLDLGARYWLSRHDESDPWDILTGHFVGIDLGAGYYDIEPHHKGYQGEFQMASVEYGYAWRLGKYWRLQAYAGLGWMATHYRYYEANKNDSRLIYKYPGRYTWMGPTKLGVSIEVIIPNDFWLKKKDNR